MKKIVIVIALFLSSYSLVVAQGRQSTPEERAQRQTQVFTEKFSLTEDQKVKVNAIFLFQFKTTDSLRNASQGDFQAVREKIKPIQVEADQKIFSLLTEEQKKKFEAYQEERKNRMQNRQQ